MYDTYIIKENDTVDSISKEYNTTENILKELNNQDLNIIPGNTIIVPKINNKYFNYYTVSRGDTIFMGNNE